MADFSYTVVTKTGKIKKGVLTAFSTADVRRQMESKELELISCQEEKKEFGLNIDVLELLKKLIFRKISVMDKINFSHHLGIMLKAGVPITEAVEIICSETGNYKFKQTLTYLITQLEEGKSLSALLKKEGVYSDAHLAILKSGEASGKVIEALMMISADLKRDHQIRKKFQSAMAYPMIVTLALIGISGFIVVFVLPKVGEVFRQMNLPLPLPTRILLFAGSFISQYFIALILGLAGLILVFLFFFKFIGIELKIFLKLIRVIPLVNKLFHEISMARFIRSLSSLFASGVAISEALQISGGVFIDSRFQKVIVDIGEQVRKGVSLTSAFKKYEKLFGGMLIKMCSVGERSGKLAEILDDLASFYEEEVEGKLENFSTIIEPVLMLLVGLGVGGMILSIIAPIYQMMGKLTP